MAIRRRPLFVEKFLEIPLTVIASINVSLRAGRMKRMKKIKVEDVKTKNETTMLLCPF